MANKYELRRRALKETQARSDNPFASPRYGGGTKPSDYTPPPPMDRRRLTLVLCSALAALITALYGQTWWHYNEQAWGGTNGQRWGHKFTVCDDNVYIYEKPQIISGLTWDHVVWAFSDAHEGNWHPLTWISHMIDWQLFSGGSWEPENQRYKFSWPGGHHLVSMGIHCINAVLLFLALRLMTGTLWPSFVVAALFGIHPLRVESVAWAAERKDVLCGLFWMASMLTYALYARRRPIGESSPSEVAGTVGMYVLVSLFIALGLMSKSMIVTLPCVFLLLDIWPLDRWKKALWPPGRKDPEPNLLAVAWLVVEKIPWFGLVYIDASITYYGQNKGVALNSFEGLPLVPRLLNAVVSCGEYLRQTVWPTGLAPFYTHPAMIPDGWIAQLISRHESVPFFPSLATIPDVWTQTFYVKFYIYAALLAVITAAAIYGLFCKRSFLAVGWFWYLGALIPVIGIIQVGTQARADRYTYLPMIGVYLMVAWLLMEVVDRWPKARVFVASASVVVLLALSAVTFRQVSYWVDSYKLFIHAKDVTEKNYFAYNHIGIAYDSDAKEVGRMTDAKAAEELFDHVSRYFDAPPEHLDEAFKQPLLLAGSARDFRAAAKQLNQAQKQQLLFDYSADAFKATIDIKPDYDFGNNNLGVYYARKNKPQDLALAEESFRRALMSNQRYADAFNNLGIILARQGGDLAGKGKIPEALKKFDDAIACHKQGLGVRNDRASDHNNLCRVYMQKHDLEIKAGDLNNAKRDLDNAMAENDFALRQCDPNFLGAWMSRAEIHLKQNNLAEAAKCVQRMVAIDAKAPETLPAEFMLAKKYLELNHPDEAIDWLDQILKVNQSAADVYNARGIAYLQKGDLHRAQQDFEQVLRIFPQYPGGQERLDLVRARLLNPKQQTP